MDNLNDISTTVKSQMMVSDEYYYKYIFKKTEKIVFTILYLLSKSQLLHVSDMLIKDVLDASQRVHDVALLSLSSERHNVEIHTRNLLHALITLESKLQLLVAVGHLSESNFAAFHNEIDSVYRSARSYVQTDKLSVLERSESTTSSKRRLRKRAGETPVSVSGERTDEQARTAKEDRKDIILNVLREKGQASIKDVSGVVTDCSEKTIQRELNNLIKDGIIIRQGERRWSTYSLVQ